MSLWSSLLPTRTVRDHVGQRVPLDLARRTYFGAHHGHMPAETFIRVRADLLRIRGYSTSDASVTIFGLLAIAGLAILMAVTFRVDRALAALFLIPVAVFIASLVSYRRFVPWAPAGVLVTVCLRHQCCPGCGYDLSTITPSRNHTRTCPECGAAWILEPQYRPPPPPSFAFRAGRFIGGITRIGTH